ncbi:uncharacterized protein [Miscanthus floridulus]|uniref:uncharacterized protein n=1 Tax=Miscanthus floridulus TaxID=154761 RepID=UPI0034590BCC
MTDDTYRDDDEKEEKKEKKDEKKDDKKKSLAFKSTSSKGKAKQDTSSEDDGSWDDDDDEKMALFVKRFSKFMVKKASNNVVEYEACLHGLRIAIELGIKRLMVYGDSTLVINRVNKDWSCSGENMDAYCIEIRKLEGKFYGIEYLHVVRDQH